MSELATTDQPSPPARRAGAARRMRKVSARVIAEAAASGLLPHEWLLKVARGEGMKHRSWVARRNEAGQIVGFDLVEEDYYADFETRLEAAKAAAPYYAAKLSAQTVSVTGTETDMVAVLNRLALSLQV
jgi:hypothetical protein